MKEILFRGRKKDGEWFYSMTIAPHVTENGKITYYYMGAGYTSVNAETVGQYTGLTDKNGTKIFEGDIVKVYEDIDYRVGVHKTNRKTRTIIGVVVFDKKRFEYKIKNEEYNLTLFRLCKKDTNEVIGNIHDNPELLGGVNK